MKVLFIGAINNGALPRGGEEYKNRLLQEYLAKDYIFSVIDTYSWKTKPFILFRIIFNLFFTQWDKIVISASSRSVYKLLMLTQFFPQVSRKIVYLVIGGYFPSAVLDGTFSINPYKHIHALVVEGFKLKETLQEAGISVNVHVVPNFKKIPTSNKVNIKKNQGDLIKFTYISRIHPDKGINEIFNACRLLGLWGYGHNHFNLTFWGPIHDEFRHDFNQQLTDQCVYGGFLNILDDTVNAYHTLAEFDVMLFPTYWIGEGFPGVLIDAFICGLPVIATNWSMNTEIIKDGINGIVIPSKDYVALAQAMKQLIDNFELREKMAINATKNADDYNIERAWPKIKEIIEA